MPDDLDDQDDLEADDPQSAPNPEHGLSPADRAELREHDQRRHDLTLADLIAQDPDYATAPVELVEADLDDAGPGLAGGADTEEDPGGARPGSQSGVIPQRFGVGNADNVADMRGIARIYRDRFGGRVLESPGWTTRGRSEALAPSYVVPHHTAAIVDIDNLLINGRPDLAGPLCNEALHADGTLVLIASGRANHAGVASVSSSISLGIEATGPIPLTKRGTAAFPQYRWYVRLVASHCLYYGWGTSRVRGHKEIALPDGRKPDPAFGSVAPSPYSDMARFRADVAAEMSGSRPPQEVDELAGEGPEILNILQSQLKPWWAGQPNYFESFEALWDHFMKLEAKVSSLEGKLDTVLSRLQQS